MATARKHGKGYEIRVFVARDINGKKIERYKKWIPNPNMTKKQIEKELERQKILFEEEVKTGVCPDGNINFFEFSKRWMKEYGEINLAPKTYARYEQFLTRINQAIGHFKLKDLKPLHLNKFYRNLEEDGVNQKAGGKLAPKTVFEHHRLISVIGKIQLKNRMHGVAFCFGKKL